MAIVTTLFFCLNVSLYGPSLLLEFHMMPLNMFSTLLEILIKDINYKVISFVFKKDIFRYYYLFGCPTLEFSPMIMLFFAIVLCMKKHQKLARISIPLIYAIIITNELAKINEFTIPMYLVTFTWMSIFCVVGVNFIICFDIIFLSPVYFLSIILTIENILRLFEIYNIIDPSNEIMYSILFIVLLILLISIVFIR